jgi:hypothetical protein
VVELLISRWQEVGLPGYAQFDNALIFQGPSRRTDVIGRVMRTCLLAGVTPVFAPPREPGFQNAVESLNGRWQAKVWRRFEHASLAELQQTSDRWLIATAFRHAVRSERAPSRTPLSTLFVPDFQAHPSGEIIFIRRTDDSGRVSLLGRSFMIDPHWVHRLVRAEVQLKHQRIRFFALRRREPLLQPLLAEHPYSLPHRLFKPPRE